MKPLEPRHHAAGVVPNEIGIDTVGIEDGLGQVRIDLVGKGSNDGVQLWQGSLHLILPNSREARSLTRQLRLRGKIYSAAGTPSARFHPDEPTPDPYHESVLQCADCLGPPPRRHRWV